MYFDVVHHQLVTIEIDDQTKFITAQRLVSKGWRGCGVESEWCAQRGRRAVAGKLWLAHRPWDTPFGHTATAMPAHGPLKATLGLVLSCCLLNVVLRPEPSTTGLLGVQRVEPPKTSAVYHRCDARCDAAWLEHVKKVHARLAAEHKMPSGPPALPARQRVAVAGATKRRAAKRLVGVVCGEKCRLARKILGRGALQEMQQAHFASVRKIQQLAVKNYGAGGEASKNSGRAGHNVAGYVRWVRPSLLCSMWTVDLSAVCSPAPASTLLHLEAPHEHDARNHHCQHAVPLPSLSIALVTPSSPPSYQRQCQRVDQTQIGLAVSPGTRDATSSSLSCTLTNVCGFRLWFSSSRSVLCV